MELIDHMPVTERGGRTIIGEGVKFERIRRITGYLVGTMDRFNNAKRAEVRDRIKHVKVT
ncbi:anaerobic ribonucleoside-triphosphate reductase [uncultured Bilophila sp.]|uniref:anaerobic ribonucleoside-triphosphate reductase n=1 Tax=uncultured Bilophila sp. TaxID=529385 RepID=UPI0025966E2A|nr:anaerobic ribonucleoside-triphosphate reductase [uncultured Bilophila sp.]